MSSLLLEIPTPRTYTLFIFIWVCCLLEFYLDMLASDLLIFYFILKMFRVSFTPETQANSKS